MNEHRSTLVGVASGRPDGGVAIVRLSGPRCRAIAHVLISSLPPPRRLALRSLQLRCATESALVAWMPGPTSYTGEDVLELHVHAGERNVTAVLEACLDAGATAAGRGDFTRRAFELGRLTLDQAEGVAALIGAQTDEALAQARRLIAGEVGREVTARREAVADLRAEIEANLDFPDDVDAGDVARWRIELAALHAGVQAWLDGFEAGRRARERLRVVLAGPPNAGKSSLFNALLGRARAIVAPTPGTTRDYVDAELPAGAGSIVLVDTAGLRPDAEAIEARGIDLAHDQLAGADLVLWLEPADTEPAPAPAVLERAAAVIRIESKRDLGTRRPDCIGAAITPTQIDVKAVEHALATWSQADRDQAWIGLRRHRDCAAEALASLDRAADLLAAAQPLELTAFELAIADARLAEITGHTPLGPIADDVLDRIFTRFCIGK
jgi:tRNA modification GTPase